MFKRCELGTLQDMTCYVTKHGHSGAEENFLVTSESMNKRNKLDTVQWQNPWRMTAESISNMEGGIKVAWVT